MKMQKGVVCRESWSSGRQPCVRDPGGYNNDVAPTVIVTRTKASDFPSLLRQKLSNVQTVERHKISTEQVDPNTECEKCGRRGIRFSEMQTRGADEGSTISYNCDCGHRWTLNN
ncbi:hypothetical protein P8C59_004792 [Phyllachora maydis]|uniref:TFIIS-type domain-containing protein n=1 Tax=Phyllachora maydis TaxID=1825666 RepID=A0AAD9I479_9PEZI|nr:hypothetical protein P8C59_004792 [Phyllachora maydis]